MSSDGRFLLVALTVPLVVAGGCAGGETEPPVTTPTVSATSVTSVSTAAPPSTARPPVQPEGFDLAPAEVTSADGRVCALCLWVAETAAQQQRGLMGVTDLGPADGMVFVYPGPSTGQFWMRGTPMPLSIAFFARDGSFVSAADMEPCGSGAPARCRDYSAARPYVAAIEVPQGRLAEFAIGPGSRLELDAGSGCDDAGP